LRPNDERAADASIFVARALPFGLVAGIAGLPFAIRAGAHAKPPGATGSSRLWSGPVTKPSSERRQVGR